MKTTAQLTWLISSIPLLAYSNTSSLGCTAVVIAAEFRGQGAPKIPCCVSAPLAAFFGTHAGKLFSCPPHCWDSLRSCDLGAQQPNRETTVTGSRGTLSPGGSSLAPCVTRRPSPAAPGASTPAGDTERIRVRRRVAEIQGCPAVLDCVELLPT